jgi:recombination protein RecA
MGMAKKQTLADVLSEFRTKDKIQIGTLASFQMIPDGLSTGNTTLDYLTGCGGVPRGRVTELFGKPSSGKTTMALQTAAGVLQRGDGAVVYLDYERTLDEGYCRALGLDVNDPAFIYYQPRSFEDGANRFRALLATGEVALVIHDSVAKMVTENELSADTGAAKVADRAKMMHQYMRQVVDPLHDSNTAAIFLNHVMDVVDASPMGQKLAARGIKRSTTPGGMALPFYASLRMEFKQVGNIRSSVVSELTGQKEDQIRSTKVQATVVKNKVGDPFGTSEVRVRFGRGFSEAYSVYSILQQYAAFQRDSNGKHTFPDSLWTKQTDLTKRYRGLAGDHWIRGEDLVLTILEEDAEWLGRMRDYAHELIGRSGPSFDKVDNSGLDENGVPIDEAAVTLDVAASDDLEVDLQTGEILA